MVAVIQVVTDQRERSSTSEAEPKLSEKAMPSAPEQQYYYTPWPPSPPHHAHHPSSANLGAYPHHLVRLQHQHQPRISARHEAVPNTKLFVGNLAWATDEYSLQSAFSAYGVITEAVILRDRESGRSRGFGFVTYASTEEASVAIQNMNGRELDGRGLRVNLASERAKDNTSTPSLSSTPSPGGSVGSRESPTPRSTGVSRHSSLSDTQYNAAYAMYSHLTTHHGHFQQTNYYQQTPPIFLQAYPPQYNMTYLQPVSIPQQRIQNEGDMHDGEV
ncbi:hypothetical protein SeLEV6574_g05609 [Synchytrium endobioticum]|nr:hypothetical protein SeLEV6574_g05609 [Synchytrium endobioticum]